MIRTLYYLSNGFSQEVSVMDLEFNNESINQIGRHGQSISQLRDHVYRRRGARTHKDNKQMNVRSLGLIGKGDEGEGVLAG